jgi:hypothetical protein
MFKSSNISDVYYHASDLASLLLEFPHRKWFNKKKHKEINLAKQLRCFEGLFQNAGRSSNYTVSVRTVDSKWSRRSVSVRSKPSPGLKSRL